MSDIPAIIAAFYSSAKLGSRTLTKDLKEPPSKVSKKSGTSRLNALRYLRQLNIIEKGETCDLEVHDGGLYRNSSRQTVPLAM